MPAPATIKSEIAIKDGPKEALKDFVIDVDAYLPVSMMIPSKPEGEKDCTTVIIDAGKRSHIQFFLLHEASGKYYAQSCPKSDIALHLQFAKDGEDKWSDDRDTIRLDAPMFLTGYSLSLLPDRVERILVQNMANSNLDLRILIGKTMKPRGPEAALFPNQVIPKAK